MPPDNVPPPRPPHCLARLTPDFMVYPHPETERITAHLKMLPGVTEETRSCITNLVNYRAVRTRARLPRGPSAAVLVALFVGRFGDLYVVLSRRSDALNTFAGDTALPGGKVDAQDGTIEDTARREAYEEIGLPRDKERVPLLCVMEPHLAKGEILVTPVVVLILDYGLQPNLNSSEVTSIFAQPLISFLSSTPRLSGGRMADPDNPYHTFTDLPWSDGGVVRLHRFLTGREGEGVKPVFGLTAAILIKTATIGYDRTPEFEVQPPNGPTTAQQIAYALLTPANPLHIACRQEGIDANRTAARLLRPPMPANTARMIEWEKIGMEWKRLMGGDNHAVDDSTQVDSAVGTSRGSSSGLCPASLDGKFGGKALQKQTGERERKERTAENGEERGEYGEDRRNAILDMAKFGEFLDKMRDVVNERMNEVKGDAKKLAKGRKTYQKIVEQVRERLGDIRDEDGELDPKSLFRMIPKEGSKGGVKAGKEGVRRGDGYVDDDGERGEGKREGGREGTRRGSGMKKHVDKDGDEHGPEQTFPRKRDTKL